MSYTKEIVSEVVDDGVKITTYKDGSQHFEPIEQPKPTIVVDERNWLQKIVDWFKTSPITPYVKCRNMSNIADKDELREEATDAPVGIEVGVKIKF